MRSEIKVHPPKRQVVYFVIVGSLGFLTDTIFLYMLIKALELNLIISRICSFLVASVITWFLHRHYTFSRVCTRPLTQFLGFLVGSSSSTILNLTIYILLVSLFNEPMNNPILATAVGSLVAAFYSFCTMKRFVFAAH